jgi:hypothetical protein
VGVSEAVSAIWSRVPLALIVAVGLLALPVFHAPAQATSEHIELEREFLDRLNARRAAEGHPPLQVNLQLTRIARDWSAQVAADGVLSHRPDLGSHFHGPWRSGAENVGRGRSVDSLHDAFMASPGHFRNAMGDFNLVGIGVVVAEPNIWVTFNFLRGPDGTFPLFRDVTHGPHVPNVEAVWLGDVTTGCAFDRFCPDATVTRAQMATFLARALGLRPESGNRFTDVDPRSAHAGFINALATAGVTAGCDAGGTRFCPDAAVRRDQMATFLARARGLAPTPHIRFQDLDPSSPHRASVSAIAAAGVTAGCDATGSRFCPEATVRRDQMASFIARAFALPPSWHQAEVR